MLFENGKQVSAEELMKKYATAEDYKKILKAPSFEVTKDRKKIDRINGGRIKSPKALMMRSHFQATDKSNNHKVQIRYAQSHNTKIVGDRAIDVFEPRYVEAKGQAFAFQHDIDLGVYLFLHPNNALSPLRNPVNKAKGKFEFVDTKKRSQAKISTINAFSDALEHAKSMDEERIVVFAKGLGIKGLEKKEPEDIRADVMEFAMKHPKIYNEKANSEVTMIEGRIINLIDKGIVRLTTVGNIRRWTWTAGEREGEHILDIQNTTQDAKQALKNFFFNDITTYMNLLENINNDMSIKAKLERDLQAMRPQQPIVETVMERVIGENLPAHLAEATGGAPSQEAEIPLPVDNNAAMALLTSFREGDQKASWIVVKQLMTAIQDGVVTPKNLREWVKINIGY